MSTTTQYSPEVRERAVRMVHDHRADYPSERATMEAIASKLGCTTGTLRRWVRQTQTDSGLHEGVTTDERERMGALEREVQELRRANEILRKPSACFAHLGSTAAASSRGLH